MNVQSNNRIETIDMQPALHVLEQTIGFVFQAALRAAVQLNIADHLTQGAKTIHQLADSMNVDAKIIKKILRVLATRNIFTCQGGTHYALTPEAAFLCSDHPYSLRPAILWLTDKTFWLTSARFAQFAYGRKPFEELFGATFFEYWEKRLHNRMVLMKGRLLYQRLKMNLSYKTIPSPKILLLPILPAA
ncbi:hypothetical protein AB6H14_05440 [Providencia vermicola]